MKDDSRMSRFLLNETIPLPQYITITPEAKEIRDRWEKKGNCFYVYADLHHHPQIELSVDIHHGLQCYPIPTGNVPDEVKAHIPELAALCVLDKVESMGHRKAEEDLHIRIEVVSDNEIILRP